MGVCTRGRVFATCNPWWRDLCETPWLSRPVEGQATVARRPKTPNRQLHALLSEAGFSRKGFARRVNDAGEAVGLPGMSYDHSSVVRWLSGQQPKAPVPDLIANVFTARLGRPITPACLGMRQDSVPPDLGLAFGLTWQESVRTITRLWDGDLRRRSFLVGAGYAVGAFAAPAMRWLTAPTDEPRTSAGTRHVGQTDVDAVREVTELFRKLDNRWGGGHPRAMVVQYLNDEVLPMLDGHYADAVGRELLAAVAQLTHLAGWMAFDLEQHGLAQRHMIQALRLARASGDTAFGGEVLAAMSQQALYVDQPGEAVDLARAAQLSARNAGIPALVSESLISEARALATLGEKQGSIKTLTAAEHALDEQTGVVPPWIGYYDEAYLSAQLGHCLLALGDLDAAESQAHRSLRMVDGYARGQTFNVTLLASIHAEQGEVEQACKVAIEATGLATAVKSERARHRLIELRAKLRPHAAAPAVRRFVEQSRTLTAN